MTFFKLKFKEGNWNETENSDRKKKTEKLTQKQFFCLINKKFLKKKFINQNIFVTMFLLR